MPRFKIKGEAEIVAKDEAEAKIMAEEMFEQAQRFTVEPNTTKRYHVILELDECQENIVPIDIQDCIEDGIQRGGFAEFINCKVDELHE